MLAFVGDFAEADVFELGPDEADGNDAEEGDEEKGGGAGGGGLWGDVEEFAECGGDGADLGEPAEDGELEDAGTAACAEDDHALRQGHLGELGAGDEGGCRLKVGEGDEGPHAEGEAEGEGQVERGAERVKAGAKAADLVADGVAKALGYDAEDALEEAGDGAAGETDGDEEDGPGSGAAEAPVGDLVEDFLVRERAAGREGDDERKEEGHGAGIEEALDDVGGDLGADGEAGFAGDEVGADEVGDAADEGDGGESDDLGAEQGEEADPFIVADEECPADSAKDIGEIDGGGGDADVCPVGLLELVNEGVEVEGVLMLGVGAEGYEDGEEDEAEDELILLQTDSVVLVGCRGGEALAG